MLVTSLKAEMKRVFRDPVLVLFVALAPFIFLLFRFAWPLGAEALYGVSGFDLRRFDSLLIAVLYQMPASMLGAAAGFLILEDRDERLFAPLSIVPGGVSGYLAVRVGWVATFSFLEALLVEPLLGLPARGSTVLVVLSCLGASPLAAVYALLLGAIARDKLEGMSVAKALSLLDFGAFLAWYAQGWLLIPAFLIPTLAPSKAALATNIPEAAAWAVASVAYGSILVVLCWKICIARAKNAGGF